MANEKLKRLKFIKRYAPRKFSQALKSGRLVPTAYEMNQLYRKKKK
jgi:hypothetical protein